MDCKWKGCTGIAEDDFTKHIAAHVDAQKDFTCMWEDCQRYEQRFSSKHTLHAHARKHCCEKVHVCSKCGKKYARNDALSRHLKHHTRVEEELEENAVVLDGLWFRKRLQIMQAEKERMNLLRNEFEAKYLLRRICEKTKDDVLNPESNS